VDTPTGFRCAACGEWHDELPLAFHILEPAAWVQASRLQRFGGVLGEEQGELGPHRFVRGLIRLPIVDGPQDFEWGVWVSLSSQNYEPMGELWEQPGREREPPYSGWLSNDLSAYPSTTLNLKSFVYTQPVGLRPLIELEPTEHPLALEQHEGITMARAEELAAIGLHPEGRSALEPAASGPAEWRPRSEQALEGWYGRAAEAGLAGAAMELALQLRDRGQTTRAQPFFRQAADAGIVEAGAEAERLEEHGEEPL